MRSLSIVLRITSRTAEQSEGQKANSWLLLAELSVPRLQNKRKAGC
jgi:hypothetical protein